MTDLWNLPSGYLLSLTDIAIVADTIETLDGGKMRTTMHIGYKQGGHAYLYDADVAYVYKLLRKGAHDVDVA